MIDEKKLIKELSKNSVFEKITNAEGKNVFEIIEAQPQVVGWIPVSERLPENCKEVLVQWEKTNRVQNIVMVYIGVGFISKHGEWCNADGFGIFNGKVIAWQPLPEPYKGEKD